MRRYYQVQRKGQDQPWKPFRVKDLPTRGPGSVIAPSVLGELHQPIREYVRQMRVGEILYLGANRRLRVIEK